MAAPQRSLTARPADQPSDIECLAAHPLFAALPRAVLADLALGARRRRYRKGHDLFRAGDRSSYVYFVTLGLIALTGLDERGGIAAVVTFSAGDVFGVAPAVLDLHHPWSATAVVDTEVLAIPRQTFCEVYQRFPELAAHIMRGLCDTMYRSQQATVRLALAPAKARVAEFLLEHAAEAGGSHLDGCAFELHLSHRTLALLMGTTRETVTRIMTDLARAGVIAIRGRRISILRSDVLRRLAESVPSSGDEHDVAAVMEVTSAR